MDGLAVDAAERVQLDEVARLVLEIYLTLSRMRYLESEWIERGPHDLSQQITRYRSHGLDDSVIYLYSVLPYVDTGGCKDVDFYAGGEFADFRNDDEVSQGRDPLYLEEPRELLKPWMTPLSMMGNHQTALIYSAKGHCIWMRCQQFTGSVDPVIMHRESGGPSEDDHGTDIAGVLDDNLGQEAESNAEMEESDDHVGGSEEGSDEDYVEEGASSNGDYAYDGIESRPAEDVLRDIKRWYEELEAVPGGGEHTAPEWDQKVTKPLYIKHGWPGEDFDGTAFLVDLATTAATKKARKEAGRPLEKFKSLEQHVERQQSSSKREGFLLNISEAEDVDEEWRQRFHMWEDQILGKRAKKRLERLTRRAQQACPNGVCFQEEDIALWEAEQLRVSLKQERASLTTLQGKRDEMLQYDRSIDRGLRLRVSYAEKRISVYERAYAEAKANAGRLYPDKTFAAVTGRAPLDQIFDYSEVLDDLVGDHESHQEELVEAREWAIQLPQEATAARIFIARFIEDLEKSVTDFGAEYRRWSGLLERSRQTS